MKKSIKIVAAVAAVGVAAAVTALVCTGGREGGERDGGEEAANAVAKGGKRPYLTQSNAAKSAVKRPQDIKPSAEKKEERAKKRKGGNMPGRLASGGDGVFRDSEGNPYPAEDQKTMTAAAEAIETDNVESARSLARKALSSGNKELRAAVVDALGWFGASAMAELTPFMSDPDEEVAESAASNWMDALQEIDDDGMKAGVVEMALKALANRDQLEDVANELIGIDELAAIQVIANVIGEVGGAAAEVAKEVYESITCDEWTGPEAAEAWLQENYEPPDAE